MSRPAPLDAAADLIRERLEVDRVSISAIYEADRRFEIVATSGARLLVRGTRLPVTTSTHFSETAEGRIFVAPSFDRLERFDRPLDEVVIAAGFHSGCAVPIRQGEAVVGAVAISSRAAEVQYELRMPALGALAGMLELTLGRPAALSIVVVHDDPLVGHGIANLLDLSVGADSVVCATLVEASAVIGDEAPDLIVADDWVGGVRVDRFGDRLRPAGAGPPLLVLASHDTPENLAAAVRAGASAYLSRSEAVTGLAAAVSAVLDGRAVVPRPGPAFDPKHDLTEREREVVRALDEGLRMKQIALRCGISELTAKCHARNAFRKLGASSRAEAVREARRQGILS